MKKWLIIVVVIVIGLGYFYSPDKTVLELDTFYSVEHSFGFSYPADWDFQVQDSSLGTEIDGTNIRPHYSAIFESPDRFTRFRVRMNMNGELTPLISYEGEMEQRRFCLDSQGNKYEASLLEPVGYECKEEEDRYFSLEIACDDEGVKPESCSTLLEGIYDSFNTDK